MANYESLKAAIQDVVKTNGNNEITGALLQQSLLAMINSLGTGYQFMGVAVLTPTATNPGTPDQNVFYIASESGTYSNFGGLSVSDGEVAILKYNGTWTKEVTGAATAAQVTQLGQQVDGFDVAVGLTTIPYHFVAGRTYLIINKDSGMVYVYGRVTKYGENITIKSPLLGGASYTYTPATDLYFVRITGTITNGIAIFDKTTFDVLIDDKLSTPLTIENEIPVAAYNGYDQTSMIWDNGQNLPVGSVLKKLRCASIGSAAPRPTKIVVFDENNTRISRNQVGTIGTTESDFDLSFLNIVVREGYKYCAECVPYKTTSGIEGKYTRIEGGSEVAYNNYLFGFAFVVETTGNRFDLLDAEVEELQQKTKALEELPKVLPIGNKILWLGDSIGEAASAGEGVSGTQRFGWSGRVADYFGGTFYSLARSGNTITKNVASGVGSVLTKLEELYNNGHTGQYLIFEGGTNDADRIGSILNGNVPAKFGTWTKDDFSGNYDEETFCGAVDSLFYKALVHYKGVKLGFIIAQKMGLSSSAYTENRRAYFDVIIEMCKKWGIPYIDLWNGSFLNPNIPNQYDSSKTAEQNTTAGSYYTDGQHLTALAYDYLAEPIAAWLSTL